MKVCELLALLSGADPEADIVFDKKSESLLLITIRPGMHQIIEECTGFTVEEAEWLRKMHIEW